MISSTQAWFAGGERVGYDRCGLDKQIASDRFDEIGALSRGIGLVPGPVAIAHADVVEKEFRHFGGVWQMRPNFRPPD